jgi:thiol:disulfide interchange protein DsbD
MIRRILILICCILGATCSALASEQVQINTYSHSFTGQNNKQQIEVLLEFKIAAKWHLFAPYAQQFGAPLVIQWNLPKDIKLKEENFSRPRRFRDDIVSFDGYQKRAYYKAVFVADHIPEALTGTARWQVCADECLSQNEELNIVPTDSLQFNEKLAVAEASFGKAEDTSLLTFILMFAAAFAGGLILNLMPCILPILGIKIAALAHVSRQNRRTEALFYSFGIIGSMLCVAGLLLILRQFNQSIGWGFQLQSPWFIAVMAVLFLVLTLLMADIVPVNDFGLSRLSLLQFRSPKTKAFMAGLLAVLIATPCSAPFMGAAIGYALMAPIYFCVPIFISLGAGYALPFALLALYPQLTKRWLPKSGKWMLVFKRILSIPLFLTALWLGWLWLVQTGLVTLPKDRLWQPYSAQKLEQALAQNKPVFIDFTAKWCITCTVNKTIALDDSAVLKTAKENGIVLLRADLTTPNKEIAEALEYYGRAGVPLYVYYDGKSEEYQILPQILTPEILLEYWQ